MIKNLLFITIAFILSICLLVTLEISKISSLFLYILIILSYILFKRKTFFNFVTLDFKRKDFFLILMFTTLIPIIVSIINIILKESPHQIQDVIKMDDSYMFWAIFIAPIIEELILRKFIIDILIKIKMNYYLILFSTASLFGICHGINSKTLILISIGVAYAYIYLKTQNIILTMILHMVNNLSYNLMFYLNRETSAIALNLLFPLIFLSSIKILNILWDKGLINLKYTND